MTQPTESPLFGLPPELRNTIYELTLMGGTTTVALRENSDGALIELPCLLRSCKQIYDEATSVFYHYTTFYSRYAYNIVCWLKALLPKYRKAISEIRLKTKNQPMALHIPRFRASIEDKFAVVDILTRRLESFGIELQAGVLKTNTWSRDGGVVWVAQPGKVSGNTTGAGVDTGM